ncbi:MAG: hypothetical protein AUI11_00660 [Acidobacteria bacterium 13_2_20CM_2_66_4]|nr:MAG: hypothetical protein AUI11_00660 [Acidobacteria bacterium 13_2_20CM_2_66_4]
MTRPLLIIFLTIFVNLVGFGIIIPLLPFYAQTFGASPTVIGLLFAVFSLCQLAAAPALGDISDHHGRRPVLVFSLLGTVISFVMLAVAHSVAMLFAARIVDGLSGGNISTARAYVADVTEPKDRARAYGLIGAAFGLGFILGPALSGVLAKISYTAPIWAAAAVTLVATVMAWAWLPETVHRAHAGTGNPFRYLPALLHRPLVRRVLLIDRARDRRQTDLHRGPRLRRRRTRVGHARAFGRGVRARARAARLRHRFRPPDGVEPRQPRGAWRRAGTRAGRRERGGKSWPYRRSDMGEQLARAIQ